MSPFIFGKTESLLPIWGYRRKQGLTKVLILGGVHGDEHEGVACAHGLLKDFSDSFDYRIDLTLVPMFNLDGVLKKTRKNINGVDLNRNLPTKDWTNDVHLEKYYPGISANSEKENQSLVSFIEKESPQFILSLHSWKPLINKNGDCQKQCEVLHKLTGYPIHEDIGYPTPGCLGTYTGLERDIPTITYEIQRDMPIKEILKTHIPAIKECLKTFEN